MLIGKIKVRQNRYRTSITIPEKFLRQFGEHIKEFSDRAPVNEEASKPNDAPAASTAIKAESKAAEPVK
jgi:hypothetical protein